MSLRGYQKDCVRSSISDFKAGIHQQLWVLPTGGGKTRCAAHIPKLLAQPREQTLFVVHRDELIWQAADAFREINPTMSVGIEKAEFTARPDTDIIVASIQTLGRVGSSGMMARLLKFNPDRIRFVILDEAHRATANAWKPLLEHLRVYRQSSPDPRKLLVGITATPERTDGIGLDLLFEKITYEIGMRKLMETGVDVDGSLYPYLTPIRPYRVTTEIDLSTARSKGGDFLEKDLAHALDTPERNRLIVRKYQELGEDLPGLGFTVNVAHAEHLSEELIANGIKSAVVSGGTDRRQRQLIYEAYDAGELKVICSCDTLNEGFDRPRATVALLARPTKSALLYRQQLGRVLRPFPAPEAYAAMRLRGERPAWVKRAAIVLDFCDLTGRHQINTVPTLFGLRPEFDMKGDSVVEVMEQVEKIAAKNPGLDLKEARSIEDVKSQVDRIDLFRAPQIRADVKKLSKFAWMEVFEGVLQIHADGEILEIRQNTLGKFELWQCRDGVRALRDTQPTLAATLTLADSMVPKDKEILLNAKARWRKDPPTENQCRKLHHTEPAIKAKYPNGLAFYRFAFEQFHKGNQNYSKGAVSAMIDRNMMKEKQAAAPEGVKQ